MPLRIYLTGQVCIEADDSFIPERRFMGRQASLVFAFLAGEQGRAVSRDELAEELWLDAPPPSWELALRAIISKVRALLAEVPTPGDLPRELLRLLSAPLTWPHLG